MSRSAPRNNAALLAALAVLAPVAFLGCGKTLGENGGQNGVEQAIANQADNESNTSTSALSAVTQALDSTEGTTVAAAGTVRAASTCPSSASACTGNLRTVLFSGCQLGTLVATGTLNLSFDGSGTCNTSLSGIPTSGSVLRTFNNFSVADAGGMTTRLITDNNLNYKNETVGGGVLLNFGSTQTVQILGMTRIKIHPNNRQIYNHSIRSVGVIQAQGKRSTRDRIVSAGTIVVNHNIKRTNTTVRLDNLRWDDETCCHPKKGTINSEITDEAGTTLSTVTIEFGRLGGPILACGQGEMTITQSGQVAVKSIVTLPSCE